MSSMSNLDIKVKEFLTNAETIQALRKTLEDIQYDYPYQDEQIKKMTDERIARLQEDLEDKESRVETFNQAEWSIARNKLYHNVVYLLRVCPFCKGFIEHTSREISCGRCGYEFYTD